MEINCRILSKNKVKGVLAMNINTTKIILASKSPRRKELLIQAGLDFSIKASSDEEIITKSEPCQIAMELSHQKASNIYKSVTDFNKDTLIIGADTIVCMEDEVMGKPKDAEDAYKIIKKLQGKTHQVYTGVTLLFHSCTPGVPSPVIKSFYDVTDVTFYEMTEEEILSYINTGDCLDKAGAYGIQGPFAIYVKEIHGDYNNVVGLPIAKLYHEIKTL